MQVGLVWFVIWCLVLIGLVCDAGSCWFDTGSCWFDYLLWYGLWLIISVYFWWFGGGCLVVAGWCGCCLLYLVCYVAVNCWLVCVCDAVGVLMLLLYVGLLFVVCD